MVAADHKLVFVASTPFGDVYRNVKNGKLYFPAMNMVVTPKLTKEENRKVRKSMERLTR